MASGPGYDFVNSGTRLELFGNAQWPSRYPRICQEGSCEISVGWPPSIARGVTRDLRTPCLPGYSGSSTTQWRCKLLRFVASDERAACRIRFCILEVTAAAMIYFGY